MTNGDSTEVVDTTTEEKTLTTPAVPDSAVVVPEDKQEDAPEVTVAEKPAEENDNGTIQDVSTEPPTFVPLPNQEQNAQPSAAASDSVAQPQGTVAASEDANPFEIDTTANIMVNFIPQSITEESFHSMFGEFGSILSSKLIIDKYTGRHIGYGFVNYSTLEAARAAIEKYNGFAIDGKWLKVVFARQSSSGTKRASLHVSGLPIFYTEDDIRKMFQPYGCIDVKLLLTTENESRGIAFVMVSSIPLGNKAIAELNNSVPDGASSRVAIKFAELSNGPVKRGGGSRPDFMPPPAGFPPYGAPAVPYGMPPYGGPPPMGRPGPPMYGGGGYGPLRHDRSSDRANPMSAPRSPVGARATGEDPYGPGENPAYAGYCLFTYNLPTEYDEQMMSALYAPYGTATDIKLMRDPETNISRGFGFVNLPTLQQAVAAINGLNGTSINGRVLKVAFKKPKGARGSGPGGDSYASGAGYAAGTSGSYGGYGAPVPPPSSYGHGHAAPQTAEEYGAAYQRALAHYQHVQQTGGDSQQSYNQAMQAYQAYQQVYQQQQAGGGYRSR